MADKTYCGGGWEKKFDNGGSIISVGIDLSKLKDLPVDSYGMTRIVIGQRKSQDEKSKQTHWAAVDGYYYEKNPRGEAPKDPEVRKSTKLEPDLPF